MLPLVKIIPKISVGYQTKFYLPTVFQLRYGTLTLNVKRFTTSHKITQACPY